MTRPSSHRPDGRSAGFLPPSAAGRRLFRGLAKGLVAGSVVALVAFHAILFWDRIASFSLFEPLVAARWLAAAVLSAAMLRLYRSSGSLLKGRRALVFWALVLLLHAAAVLPADGIVVESAVLEAALLAALPLSLAPVALGVVGSVLGHLGRVRAQSRPPFLSRFDVAARLALQGGGLGPRLPRPPPA